MTSYGLVRDSRDSDARCAQIKKKRKGAALETFHLHNTYRHGVHEELQQGSLCSSASSQVCPSGVLCNYNSGAQLNTSHKC
eukprot:scaffold26723_cov153-Skeletonema_menzelii.AAC.3